MARGCRGPALRAAAGVAAHRGRRIRLVARGRSTAKTCSSSSTTTAHSISSSCKVSASDPTGPREVVVPHRPGERLLGVSTFRDWGVLGYRRGGLARLGMLDYATGAVAELEFDEPLYSVGSGGNPEWAPPLIRLGYGSFVTPGTVFDYDVATGELLLRKRQPVLGGYDAADYAQARVWATAQDGTQIPISLVWKRSFGDAGAAPAPAAPVRLRLVRALDRAGLLGAAPVGARPRRHLRGRARARRRRDGPSVVRRRQAAAQAQHLHRLRGLRAAPRRARLHDRRPHGRRGRHRRAAC